MDPHHVQMDAGRHGRLGPNTGPEGSEAGERGGNPSCRMHDGATAGRVAVGWIARVRSVCLWLLRLTLDCRVDRSVSVGGDRHGGGGMVWLRLQSRKVRIRPRGISAVRSKGLQRWDARSRSGFPSVEAGGVGLAATPFRMSSGPREERATSDCVFG